MLCYSISISSSFSFLPLFPLLLLPLFSLPYKYTQYMREFIKRTPSLVIKLRATFLKVGSMF